MWTHARNEAQVTIARKPLINKGGENYGYRESWNISGLILAPDSAALQTVMFGMKNAYGRNGGNLGIYFDNGQVTNHFLNSAQTNGGTVVTDGPNFPEWRGAELGTVRTYSITVEAEVLDLRIGLMDWTENLTFEGGGPMIVHLQTLTGFPQKQQTAESLVFRATQEGQAIGLTRYPLAPGPIWPAALKESPKIYKGTPTRKGLPGIPTYTMFPLSWKYSFEDVFQLSGNPNLWL